MKKAGFIAAALGIILLVMLPGCGKSLFAPFTTSGVLSNPELALERADYLYLGGDIARADEIYVALIEEYAEDEEYRHVYFDALRGHSKCALEPDTEGADSTAALKSFIGFATSVDTETFSLDAEGQTQQDEFAAQAAAFKEAVWNSFTILLDIPIENRTEADFGNMSISGLFTVCVDFLTLMTETIGATANVMQKVDEMNTQIEDFNTKWAEAETIENDPDPGNWTLLATDNLRTDLGVLANDIDAIYTEITGVIDLTIATLTDLQDEGNQVKTETAPATNALTVLLNGIFDVIIDIANGTLPPLIEMRDGVGDFYTNFDYALNNW